MRIKYDKDTDILTIRFTDKKPVESEHFVEEGVVIDYDDQNNVVGLEIFDWSEKENIVLPFKIELSAM